MSEKLNVNALRLLPSVDAVLQTGAARDLRERIGRERLTELARQSLEKLRRKLSLENEFEATRESLLIMVENDLRAGVETRQRQQFQRIINATGVIIHTNLGRAPLAQKARQAIGDAVGYCTLEYDLETGKRGKRGRAAEDLFCEITSAESCLIVNNCAAAAFLVLTALGKGGEAVISRGELVEIGGDFRVPDVMAQANVKMVEVGTTNRTKLNDFADAINEQTKIIARVHPSNFRVVGFTAMPELNELSQLARAKNVILFEDAGSGALINLSQFGLDDEPVISQSIAAGADVVTFSADKLLGGVQAGIIVGKREIIEQIRGHPLYRALRVDKIVYAALAATLEIYERGRHFQEIPVLQMLAQTKAQIEQRAAEFCFEFQVSNSKLNAELENGFSKVGGGSAPLAELPTMLIALSHGGLSADELERRLRLSVVPIIARVAENRVLLDLRTVTDAETSEILAALRQIAVKG